MERTRHKHLALILARQLAENVATPIFVIDPDGTLIYFNEPAEHVLGQSFAATGELAAEDWGTLWRPRRVSTDEPLDPATLPLTVAMDAHVPTSGHMRITTPDGNNLVITVMAIPLMAAGEEFVGAMAVFWEETPGQDGGPVTLSQ